MGRLAGAFAEAGYEGASLARLAEASGLKKASLYHRFPGGKAQMAKEVLATVLAWVEDNVLATLAGDGTGRERLARVAAAFTALYDGGRRACLLNMLSTLPGRGGPCEGQIAQAFTALVDGFARFAEAEGATPDLARVRAVRAVALLQGSLVLSRGTGDTGPFADALNELPQLLGVRTP